MMTIVNRQCFRLEKGKLTYVIVSEIQLEEFTLPVHGKVIDCTKRRDDKWGKEVLSRVENCIDLVAAEAVYHSACMAEFRLNETETGNNKGRPEDKYMSEAFNTLCEWLENSAIFN